jgi:hypothetical protein
MKIVGLSVSEASVKRDFKSVVSIARVLDGIGSFSGLGLSFTTQTEVLAAPVESEDFQTRFIRDVVTLRSLIKDVTLGTQQVVAGHMMR